VVAGTILKEVHADYVLLERAGLQHKVDLEMKYSGDKTAAKLASSMGAIPTVQETQAHQAALRAAQEARLNLQGMPAAPNAQNKPPLQNNSGSQNNRAESRAGLRAEHRRGQQDVINSGVNSGATDRRGANLGQP